MIEEGDIVELVCPVPAEGFGIHTRGVVVHVYPSGMVFDVRVGSKIVVVTDHEARLVAAVLR